MNVLNEFRLSEPHSRAPRSGDNLAVEWGESVEQELEFDWEDHCKGSHCDSSGIDKI